MVEMGLNFLGSLQFLKRFLGYWKGYWNRNVPIDTGLCMTYKPMFSMLSRNLNGSWNQRRHYSGTTREAAWGLGWFVNMSEIYWYYGRPI